LVAWAVEGAATVGAVALSLAGSAGASGLSERLVPVGGHFETPVYATAPSSQPGRLFVVEQVGKIIEVVNGKQRSAPFLDISSIVKSGGEQGLLSMAFDPGYARSHLFYVDYTDLNGNIRVVRYRSDGTVGIRSSAKSILFVKDVASNHNGGQLQFGPDGRLYWSNGDGGQEDDAFHLGQELNRPFAKIESRDVHNPKATWKIVAFGLRNPWRFSFDAKTGALYIADVGQNTWEEIDYLPHVPTGPVNFGWSHYEGLHLFDPDTPLLKDGPYVAPILDYPHSEGCSVTGGYVYRGNRIPNAVGRYFYGDYCTGTIWSIKFTKGHATQLRREPFTVRGLSSFGEDAQGNLYLISVNSGDLFRLAA
jgi:glucose/arabinose dehydrogenase